VRRFQITMAIFGAILGIEGILDMAIPVARAAGMGLGLCAEQAQLAMSVLGATWLVVGAGIILAARNPSRNYGWVNFVVALPIALILGLVLAALRGGVAIRQIALELGLNALFVMLLITFFPRSSTRPNDPKHGA
jgi:hypothetical protein